MQLRLLSRALAQPPRTQLGPTAHRVVGRPRTRVRAPSTRVLALLAYTTSGN